MPLTTVEFEVFRSGARNYRRKPLATRLEFLKALEGWILGNLPDIRRALSDDLGKPAMESDLTEAYGVLGEIRHARSRLPEWMADQPVGTPLSMIGTRAWSRQEPKGVCLLIGPWNFPFLLMVGPLVSALAAGNAAILKPSEFAPATGRLLAQMVAAIFPTDLVCVKEGDHTVSEQLLTLPFDHVFFTGSARVGKIVHAAATQLNASVTLELGGQCPAIVCADADLEDAARKIVAAKFFNCGQACVAPDHVLVDARVFDPFLNILREQVTALFGDSQQIEQSPDYGRLIHRQHAERLHKLLNDALASGAVLRLGGISRPEQRFMAPTIITGTASSMRIRQEEIFGPILPVEPFESLETVLLESVGQDIPLAVYAFTRSRTNLELIRDERRSGALLWNDCAVHFLHPGLAFGGLQGSGLGRAHGHAGFLTFSNQRSILKQRTGWTGIRLFYPPYSRLKSRLADLLLRWF